MNFAEKTVAIIATVDSKGPEISYVRAGLQSRGREVCLLDIGTAGDPKFSADISREQIAARAGGVLQDLAPAEALALMAKGAKAIVTDLVSRGEISVVVGIGGGKGAGVFVDATKDLPFGFPKVLITSGRPAMLANIATTSDTILFPTLVDLFGLNHFTQAVLNNAVAAISGLDWSPQIQPPNKTVAITAFGVTTPAAQAVKSLLEDVGIVAIVFPANGAGGRTMESMIANNAFDGVIDLTTTELADLLLGGTASAGASRLTAAGKRGIPQAIAPGAVDMANFGPPESVPRRFADHITYRHTPMTTLVRTTVAETTEIARMTAERLNLAKGPVRVFWPKLGVSDYDQLGKVFYDPAANAAWRAAIGKNLKDDITVVDTHYHINDPKFAALCADWMIEQIKEVA